MKMRKDEKSPKILDLLASFCQSNDQIVHVNQDTISTILKDENNGIFLEIKAKDNKLFLEFEGLDKETLEAE
jgi:hypothetical protein